MVHTDSNPALRTPASLMPTARYYRQFFLVPSSYISLNSSRLMRTLFMALLVYVERCLTVSAWEPTISNRVF